MEKNITPAKIEEMDFNVTPGFTSKESYKLLWNMAKMFSSTSLVPDQFKGEKHIGDCAVAINMAQRMGADPLMVLQNLYIVYGNPAWSSKFLIATFNRCGRYSSIHYNMSGKPNTDDYGCQAWASEKDTGEVIEGPVVTIGIAKKEGWYDKKMSKWQTMPEQMLRYRAASWFIRTTAPELSMGLQTVEEVHDTIEKDITPVAKPTAEIAEKSASETIDAPKTLPDTKAELRPDLAAKKAEKREVVKSTPKPPDTADPDKLPEEPDF